MNKLLARQIKRKLGMDKEISSEFQALLNSVNDSYNHYERDRKIIERAMEISSQEMIVMNQKLLIMQNELEQKNKELDEFVSVASHDLKAPLRSITSFIQLLEGELKKGAISENAKEYFGFIKSASSGMNNLILSLLDYAKVNKQIPISSAVDINQIISSVKKNLHCLIQENEATINFPQLPIINGIPHHILQLFQNLVGNAIKFKKDKVSPIINISYTLENDNLIFRIEDNGIGISEEGKIKVFKAFERGIHTERYDGTGLGLSICKNIVEKLGGKIWIESSLGVGTTFIFSVPKVKVISFPTIKSFPEIVIQE